MIKLLKALYRTHRECEDCWYSCPKSGECCDDRQEDCNCGANQHNKKVDEAIEKLESLEDQLGTYEAEHYNSQIAD